MRRSVVCVGLLIAAAYVPAGASHGQPVTSEQLLYVGDRALFTAAYGTEPGWEVRRQRIEDGGVIWRATLNDWRGLSTAPVRPRVTISDITSDDTPDVVVVNDVDVGAGHLYETRVMALDGRDGRILWETPVSRYLRRCCQPSVFAGSDVAAIKTMQDADGDANSDVFVTFRRGVSAVPVPGAGLGVAVGQPAAQILSGATGGLIGSIDDGERIRNARTFTVMPDLTGDGAADILQVDQPAFTDPVLRLWSARGELHWERPVSDEHDPVAIELDGDPSGEIFFRGACRCALDGNDGARLWQIEPGAFDADRLGDVNGDGIDDLFVWRTRGSGPTFQQSIAAVSGSKLESLWETSIQVRLDDRLLRGLYSTETVDLDRDGIDEVILAGTIQVLEGPESARDIEGWLGRIDGASGSLSIHAGGPLHRVTTLLGSGADLDGDGIDEFIWLTEPFRTADVGVADGATARPLWHHTLVLSEESPPLDEEPQWASLPAAGAEPSDLVLVNIERGDATHRLWVGDVLALDADGIRWSRGAGVEVLSAVGRSAPPRGSPQPSRSLPATGSAEGASWPAWVGIAAASLLARLLRRTQANG